MLCATGWHASRRLPRVLCHRCCRLRPPVPTSCAVWALPWRRCCWSVRPTTAGNAVLNNARSHEGLFNPGQPLACTGVERMTPPEAADWFAQHGYTVTWQIETRNGGSTKDASTSRQSSTPPQTGYVIDGVLEGTAPDHGRRDRAGGRAGRSEALPLRTATGSPRSARDHPGRGSPGRPSRARRRERRRWRRRTHRRATSDDRP